MKRLVTLLFVLILLPLAASAAPLTTTPQTLPFTQTWTNIITTSDDWSGVPGIVSYRGDDLVTTTGADPQTILALGTGTRVDVNANPAKLQVRIMTTNAAGNDEWVGVDDILVTGTPLAGDLAPTVVETTPAEGTTGVAENANLFMTFSEPVIVAGAWFDITCATSGSHSAASSGSVKWYILNPDVDFALGEQCTVTIRGAQVHDEDTDDPPDVMAVDYVWHFSVRATTGGCGQPFTAIPAVQGTGQISPLVGQQVTVQGIVAGVFDRPGQLDGFFLEDEYPDGDPLTSNGLFVSYPTGPGVGAMERVRVTGTVAEYNGLTELKDVTAQVDCSGGVTVQRVATVDLPEAVDGDLERYEGMFVEIPETLTVSQNYFLGRYGQVTVSAEGRMYVPLNGNGLGDTTDYNRRRMLVLDDGRSTQNPNPIPYLGADGTLRAGSTVTHLYGFIDEGQIDPSGTLDYRLHPTIAPSFAGAPRPATPHPVAGTLKVASMNVLNYFTTLDTGALVCGPAHNLDCRGANTPAELTRQRDKLLAALIALDADVVGLMEIENTDDAATADLVAGLNAHFGAGTYEYVIPPSPGTDAIRVGLIYRPAVVQPVGSAHNYQTSTAAYNPLFDRPPLARVFRHVSTGEVFAVVVNHFRSKGSCPASGPDVDTGQGCWNAKRVAQATALLNIVQTLLPVDPDVLVLGDLNSYGEEDPIDALTGGGLANLVAAGVPAAERYSYVFNGEAGYLDQALATGALARQVSGVAIWHINADEPSVLDYNTEFKPQDLYTATPYRSSDHDPVVVRLQLGVRTLYLPFVTK